MTEEEMLQELKDWDLESWDRFKKENYETIVVEFPKDD
jgi:hypothetical protein